MGMKADIVIVNWNSGEQLRSCLASIEATVPPDQLGTVVVVDNGSRDDSLAGLAALALPLCVLRNQENRGFAAACNQGAAAGHADAILFLNPDARLEAGSLERPLELMADRAHEDVGIAGIQLLHEDGTVARCCARIPRLPQLLAHTIGLDRLSPRLFPGVVMRDWAHDRSADVGHVMGAFLLIRRSLFERLGGFDEQFFVYYEDLDLSARAAAAGARTRYLVEARAHHRGGGTSEQVPVERLCYAARSRVRYAAKHHGRVGGWSVLAAVLLLEFPMRMLWAILRGNLAGARHSVRALGVLLRQWRALSPAAHASALQMETASPGAAA
jgi:GT2 family glycosyltransferase